MIAKDMFRYLASGCSFAEFHYSSLLDPTAIRQMARQVCQAFCIELKDVYLPAPFEERRIATADRFKDVANFPNFIGAISGKHNRVIKPFHSGSVIYSYKHYFSYALLAVCDSDCRFVSIGAGADGRESDSTIFRESMFFKALCNELNLSGIKPISNMRREPLPHVFVGDEAFGLSEHVMRPCSGKQLQNDKRIFNCKLSRARRSIECSFGILSNKWLIFHRPLNVNRDFAVDIIKACCLLHNYIREKDACVFNIEDTLSIGSGFHAIPVGNTEKRTRPAIRRRNVFAEFFFDEGAVSWQNRRL